MESQTLTRSIKLIDGVFTALQANDIIKDLIDTKINHHKLNRLRLTEGNQNDHTPHDNSRLTALTQEKERLLEIIKKAKQHNKKIKLISSIDIEYID